MLQRKGNHTVLQVTDIRLPDNAWTPERPWNCGCHPGQGCYGVTMPHRLPGLCFRQLLTRQEPRQRQPPGLQPLAVPSVQHSASPRACVAEADLCTESYRAPRRWRCAQLETAPCPDGRVWGARWRDFTSTLRPALKKLPHTKLPFDIKEQSLIHAFLQLWV